jgi:hypothetical protein
MVSSVHHVRGDIFLFVSNPEYMTLMNAMILQLSDTLTRELQEVGQLTNQSPEVVAQDMLRRMVAIRRLERVRNDVLSAIKPEHQLTEEQIFERIS